MEKFLEIISNEVFIDFLSTFGLAVLLVAYFVFVRGFCWVQRAAG